MSGLFLQIVGYTCKLCNEKHKIEDEIFSEHYEANFPPARLLSEEEVRKIFGDITEQRRTEGL